MTPVSGSRLIACHECDALQRRAQLAPGRRACCVRCGGVLYRRPRETIDDALAWTVAALALLMIANSFPVVSLVIEGQQTNATLLNAAHELYQQDKTAIAVLVLTILIVMPVLELTALLYLLAPLRHGRVVAGFAWLFRMVHALRNWQMFEVFMLGIFVSVVKLAHLAKVIPGLGLWAFFGLMFTTIAANASYDEETVWDEFETLRGKVRAGPVEGAAG